MLSVVAVRGAWVHTDVVHRGQVTMGRPRGAVSLFKVPGNSQSFSQTGAWGESSYNQALLQSVVRGDRGTIRKFIGSPVNSGWWVDNPLVA